MQIKALQDIEDSNVLTAQEHAEYPPGPHTLGIRVQQEGDVVISASRVDKYREGSVYTVPPRIGAALVARGYAEEVGNG